MCAALIEMGEAHWDKVMEVCNDLIARRYEMNSALSGGASFEKVAKVFARMASVCEKRKQFDQAIEWYNKSMTEDNTRQTRNALRELERTKEKYEKEAYLDDAKAEEHRVKGNEYFKEKDWAKAKGEYDEGVKRNPKDPKLYSNRAAALTKLLAYPDALRDLEDCLKLDPNFIKAYSRKGAAHFFMKEYHKALQAYENGLQIDKDNQECMQGREQVLAKIQETNRSGQVDEEQIRHAMADPEIQNILHDPQINMFLKDMQENPAEAQKAMMADPKLQEAVSKLMAAGIIRTG
uniref:STI1 domain-containing protein n=1 Tax=Strombidinopsis acuminata TaxID=141414 RepID=A0A7S3WW33_9SPIT